MHLYTHPKPEKKGQAGRWQTPYHDTMVDHDKNIGQVLDYLDELGIADDTFVMYSTDNGPHMNSWPDGGMTPFRSEKNTNWEGAFRVPMVVRWPGKIKPGQISNGIVQHTIWFPTFLAMAGDPDVVEKLKSGYQAIGDKHLQEPSSTATICALPDRRGEGEPAQLFHVFERRRRRAGGYATTIGRSAFMEQRCHGTLQVWAEPFMRSGSRRSSICAPTLTSGRIRRPTLTMMEWSITFTTSTCCRR